MYHSIAEIQKQCHDEQKPFWKIVLEDDMQTRNVSAEESFAAMAHMLKVMKEADQNYDPALRSNNKKAGGMGEKLAVYNEKHTELVGSFIGTVMEKAVKMAESNACMRRIVAAPTAGSAGVIPAVLLSYKEHFHPEDSVLTEALFVAAGIGSVIAENASIAGASGGCQAEIGSASAMAAGALVYLQGGDAGQIGNAAALALKNMLGLACDPVGGLVEIPCIKRNSHGAVNAVTSAQMALAGITSGISPDDVIDSMRRIGNQMHSDLRETGIGGLAATPSAKCYLEKE